MKIRITTGAIPGIAKGAILDATPNGLYIETMYRWFVNGKGIYAYEAKEIQEKPDYEDKEAQNTEVPVLQNEDGQSIVVAGRSVPIRDRGDMDVPMLPAQPTRQANEDAERLIGLFPYLSDEDAIWLRETLLGWLQIMVARGEKLGYIFAADEQPIIDALAALEL